jgi:hypothetical protein
MECEVRDFGEFFGKEGKSSCIGDFFGNIHV